MEDNSKGGKIPSDMLYGNSRRQSDSQDVTKPDVKDCEICQPKGSTLQPDSKESESQLDSSAPPDFTESDSLQNSSAQPDSEEPDSQQQSFAQTSTDCPDTRQDAVRQLKAARRKAHVTQEELAMRIGTKKSNISRFESGRYNPSLDFLIKVAEGLGRQLHIYVK